MVGTAKRAVIRQDARASSAEPLRSRRLFLSFRLSGCLCALPLKAIREVVALPLLSRPPGRPSLLEGFLNLGGSAVPVLRLDRLFNLPELIPSLYTPLLILRQPEDRLALLVESVQGILSLTLEDVRPVRGGDSFNDCLEGEITVGDQVVHLLSSERLLLEKERQCLAELQAVEQERLRSLEEVRS